MGEVGRVSQLMSGGLPRAAWGFLRFGPGHGVETRFSLRHIGVAPEEISHLPVPKPNKEAIQALLSSCLDT